MENQRYMQEGLDLKRMFLFFKNKLWILGIAALAGALTGGGIYMLLHVISLSDREYQSVSKLYLDFNCRPEEYNELSYNGYTWNDLMATDPILNTTMEELPSGIDRETVIQATKAEILSDIRLLTITITTNSPELTAQIMAATQKALVKLGETEELFHSIEVYSTSEPRQILWDDRTLQAVLTGMVLALLAGMAGMAFCEVLDDSVYVEADMVKRYGIPALGVLTGEIERSGKTVRALEEELLTNYTYICREKKAVALIGIDEEADAEKTKQRLDMLLSQKQQGAACKILPVKPGEEDSYEKIRETDGAVVAVRFGRRNGRRLERVFQTLKLQDCPVLGVVIIEADARFLRLYYGSKKR